MNQATTNRRSAKISCRLEPSATGGVPPHLRSGRPDFFVEFSAVHHEGLPRLRPVGLGLVHGGLDHRLGGFGRGRKVGLNDRPHLSTQPIGQKYRGQINGREVATKQRPQGCRCKTVGDQTRRTHRMKRDNTHNKARHKKWRGATEISSSHTPLVTGIQDTLASRDRSNRDWPLWIDKKRACALVADTSQPAAFRPRRDDDRSSAPLTTSP